MVHRFLGQAGPDDGRAGIWLDDLRPRATEIPIVHHGPDTASPRTDLFATVPQDEARWHMSMLWDANTAWSVFGGY